jgi:alkanesulfonate monooxygenase SsuD/methylene tetrahydromethanopterin reductase-like flavin-dependent oxidoreductase (luciferase family)
LSARGQPATRALRVRAEYDQFANACAEAGCDPGEFDVCKLSFVAIAENARSAERMLHELAKNANLSADEIARRTLVGTPEIITDYLRSITDIGVNHHTRDCPIRTVVELP